MRKGISFNQKSFFIKLIMSLKAGIVGLPNVGKSSLFAALTNSTVEIANYPFATIEPNTAIVEIKDPRLIEISRIVKPEKIIFSTFTFVDIAGLIEGASKGEGLGNKFLNNIRDVDCIVQVVRCFEDEKIIHVNNKISPKDDIETINYELILSDLAIIDNVLKRVSRRAQNTGDKNLKIEYNLATKLEAHLKQGLPARDLDYSDEELKILSSWQLLSQKPMLYVGNVDQKSLLNLDKNSYWLELVEIAKSQNTQAIVICAALEQEIAQLDEEDKKIFLSEYNLKNSSLDSLIYSSFKLLNLSTFFTAGVKEVRSWTYKTNSLAPQCGAVIHSDFEKKFIRVEVISYKDFIELGGEKNARDQGKQKIEGKNYIVQDGDVCHFRIGQ
ncbi:GTP-binding and nucleic acid-binding protein YchF [Mesomycoplasma conjunctivae]|uniref:Ribosome-binding ATPase YchF n=2 Tax=Mesomycoplasma conjunctivae TaxID=45361 RepID=C5J6P9_MESCH|nr:redox-regulated ATPase YchF [Mesomycoplasma conjunctivae]CAT05159.1 GTP-binding protein [Mesomycoplasma conjunctivae]VEU66167.1 GTP-binding and nucleic acid-binding protein YchF [Mesomycoplasma conjunctivae]